MPTGEFTRINGYDQVRRAVHGRTVATRLHPSQLAPRSYAVRVDGHNPPTFGCVPVSPAVAAPKPIPETYADIEARGPSILARYAEPGTSVVLLPAGGGGNSPTRRSTWLELDQVMKIMRLDEIICTPKD